MNDYIHICIYENSDHSVREVKTAFRSRDAAKAYCEENLSDDLVESDATHQVDDYLYSNGIDRFGYDIQRTRLQDGDTDE